MNFKSMLRNKLNYVCFLYNRLLQLRKKFYINLHGNWLKYKIPFVEKLHYHKKSDTFFILGSGETINELTPLQWKIIKQHDSIGFNNWIVHDFTPDIYSFEISEKDGTKEIDLEAMNNLFHNIKTKADQYQNVQFIFKMNTDLSHNPLPLIKNLSPQLTQNFYFSPVTFLSYDDLSSLRKALKIGFRSLENSSGFQHIHTAASVFDFIAFAVKFKFKKIVLVGIDLTTTYFFETKNYKDYRQKKDIIVPHIVKGGVNYQHPTLHPTESRFAIPISVILDELDKTILRPRGINLYVASKNSKLYPRFPCFFDKD